MSVVPPREVAADTTLSHEVDVVVIGGGIVGASAALCLAERGVKVALCEKGVIGGEQSCRNWGWTRQMGRDVAEIPLTTRSLALWSEMGERVEGDVGFRRTGISYLCRDEVQLRKYDAWMKLTGAYHIDTKVIPADRLSEAFPGLSGQFAAAVYTPSDGRAEPSLAAPLIARAARRRGAHVLVPCAVRAIETRAGAVCGVVTERGAIACDRVVLAGGVWSRLIARGVGVSIPQLQVLVSAARVEAVDGNIPTMPVGGDNFAVRARLDGGYTVARRGRATAPITVDSFRLFGQFARTLIKSRGEFRLQLGRPFIESWKVAKHRHTEDVSIFEENRVLDPQPETRLNAEALANLTQTFPSFSAARLTHEWAGYIDVTPDAIPIIGCVSEVPGLFLATGFSGHGFGSGPAGGELAADLVTGRSPRVDASPFRFERFARDRR